MSKGCLILEDQFDDYAEGSTGDPIWTPVEMITWTRVVPAWRLRDRMMTVDIAAHELAYPRGVLAYCLAGETSWRDYLLEVEVSFRHRGHTGGNVGIWGHYQENGGYELVLGQDGNTLKLVRADKGFTEFDFLQTVSTEVELGPWYRLGLAFRGSQVDGYVDGKSLVSAVDSTYQAGQIGLKVHDAAAAFRSVRVWMLV